jgi:hypothetical protein
VLSRNADTEQAGLRHLLQNRAVEEMTGILFSNVGRDLFRYQVSYQTFNT